MNDLVKGVEEALDEGVADMLRYIDEARVLAAKNEYIKVMRLIEETDHNKELQRKVAPYQKQIETMLNRDEAVTAALNCTALEGNDWVLGSHYFGVTTHYRLDSDGQISVRLEGEQEDIPLFEVLSVIYEVELYKDWVPFCNQSDLVQRIAHAELVMCGSVSVPLIGVSRDAVLHAYGTDCLHEHGAIVVIGSSIEHAGLDVDGLSLPPRRASLFHDRADVKYFRAVINVHSLYSAKAIIICKIDPKISLPQYVINFVMQKLAGVLLYLLTKQAAHLSENADDTSYIEKIRANQTFYTEWLLPKFRAYIDHMGWEQPIIQCLDRCLLNTQQSA